jgi:tRNA(fMet)-specific endonuclease VapC
MANKIVLVDTSILIDYYPKTDKEKSVWINLVRLLKKGSEVSMDSR